MKTFSMLFFLSQMVTALVACILNVAMFLNIHTVEKWALLSNCCSKPMAYMDSAPLSYLPRCDSVKWLPSLIFYAVCRCVNIGMSWCLRITWIIVMCCMMCAIYLDMFYLSRKKKKLRTRSWVLGTRGVHSVLQIK